MSRTFVAFLVAPLWVPVATAPFAAQMFPYPAQSHWIYITTVIAIVFAYGGALAFGVPTFLILRTRNCGSFWIAAVLGFGISSLTWMIFAILFGLSLGNGLTFVWRQATNFASWWPLPPIGALGSLVGATFWMIARPDRTELPTDIDVPK